MSSQVQNKPNQVGTLPGHRLRAVILLAGIMRKERFGKAIGRSKLDLPLDEKRTILNHWQSEISELASGLDRPDLGARILLNKDSPKPEAITDPQGSGIELSYEFDVVDYRGTAGVLRDVSQIYGDEDVLLVCNAYQILVQPLLDVYGDLAGDFKDIRLISHRDGTPSGMMLIKCGALRSISPVGFVDLKEQALPDIARRHTVSVLHRNRPTGLPIKSRADYVLALRQYHSWRQGLLGEDGQLTLEDWRHAFGIVESGASVAKTARIHSSVVLAGAVVEAGAILVRSVICGGATVAKGATVVDRMVAAG